jgi:pimeloyl-ACP methyl ester carboxylesterase
MLAAEPASSLYWSGIPVLVLRGDKDTYATGADTDALVALVGAASRKTYANTGHAVHWEQPTTFANDVIEFRRDRVKASR